MLSTKFRVNWPFGTGEEVKNRFPKWRQYWQSWTLDGIISATFVQVNLIRSTMFRVTLPFRSGEKANGGHLGFPIETIKAF